MVQTVLGKVGLFDEKDDDLLEYVPYKSIVFVLCNGSDRQSNKLLHK